MKQSIYIFVFTCLAIAGGLIIPACSDMDDYLKYTDGKEIIYTGKVDAMIFRSGKERVVFNGWLVSDPSINKVSIYYNNRKDSVILPVERTDGIDILEHEFLLPEGTYNFEVYTYNGKGNSSVVSYETGKSYGVRYMASLYDRPIKSMEQKEDYVLIEWYNADPTAFVELVYEDDVNRLHTRYIEATSDTTWLMGCKPASVIQMQTCYLPDYSAIDTFRVGTQPKYINADSNFTSMYLKNTGEEGSGISGTVVEGNFGFPNDWFVSEEVKVDGGKQGWSRTDKAFYFESLKDGNIDNGKVYQTIRLPKGKYTASYNCLKGFPSSGNLDKVDIYFTAAKGQTLPDIQNLETDDTTLSFYRIEKGVPVRGWTKHDITFSVDEEDMEITLGFVMNLKTADSDKTNSSYEVNEIKLVFDAVF
jgi:hypothetical protein